ncbi:hypothetical protein E4U35_004980 [Claviceps purpurea]|nr:hypothetical protein E4U35_004980 [Claviceps purpurea]KAG6219389.1 hypothetical protein E4U50_003697 [Claviceps purpurea]KAG6256574.1 hypothetical protein E4U24_005474 [Claviceps purpurea]
MEPSGSNDRRTDHNRDITTNGVNGGEIVESRRAGAVKGGVAAGQTGASDDTSAGAQESLRRHEPDINEATAETQRNRMNDLPDEIVHITQGFVPLSLLFTRLAQVSHNALQDKIVELAKMPLPVTGNNGVSSSYSSSGPDDTSPESLRKKGALLQFAQEWHGKWLKALVIAEWSRQSHQVSKLIDLKFHIDQQAVTYEAAVENIIHVKRDLAFARVPSPDLKTALQVLGTGSAPWMPDLHYIQPPALTPEEQLKWTSELNTLLSLRLNLYDYDKIPPQFRDYEIRSGRVTFKVDGEFEVDLTIADEDFEKQFWYIEFRFAFKPAPSRLSDFLRSYVEGGVNDALGKEGLGACYKFLHEFVLTIKIQELRRQALQLSRTSWTGTLKVEPLNRALAIQYWTSRPATNGLKSWVLIAVNSNRMLNGKYNANSSSQLVAKWYRDGKAVQDHLTGFDVHELSVQSLLTNVIAQHIEHILGDVHSRLLTAARYKRQEAGMVFRTCKNDPVSSMLTIQVGCSDKISLLLEPKTGVFAIKPQSKFSMQPEHQLNNGSCSPEDGVNCLEQVRCAIMEDEVHRRGPLMGWNVRKAAMTAEELRSLTRIRDWSRVIWLQKEGWDASWCVVIVLSLGGDEWWLIESNRHRKNDKQMPQVRTKIPLNGYPELSYAFWNDLAFFTTGLITRSIDLRELHRQKIKNRSNSKSSSSASPLVLLPSIEIALSAFLPATTFTRDGFESDASASEDGGGHENLDHLSLIQHATGNTVSRVNKAWADDIVNISFKGIKSLAPVDVKNEDASQDTQLICISEAVIRTRISARSALLSNLADGDVSYNSRRGQFLLRIERAVGMPMLDTLKSRIMAIDRFVKFLEAMDSAGGFITTDTVTLRRIAFYYSEFTSRRQQQAEQNHGQDQTRGEESRTDKRWRVVLDLSKQDIEIEIEKGNPHLRVLDLMRQLVNCDDGISRLMSWLPTSLPALQAIDEIASLWVPFIVAGRGYFDFSMKTAAWMNLTYTIGTVQEPQSLKIVSVDVKMKSRRGEAWWHVWRSDTDANSQDDISRALKRVWDSKGEGWIGLATGAAGRPQKGVGAMLLAVDEAVRGSVTDAPAENNEVVVLD